MWISRSLRLLLFGSYVICHMTYHTTNGQQRDLPPKFEYITVDDELSHSDVTKIVQDTLGYIWLGTNSGLNRFDGRNIRIFKHGFLDDQSLPDNRITELYLDSRGKLWIGTETGGLCWYDDKRDRFVRVPLPTHLGIRNNVSAIYEDKLGRMWIGTKHDGIFLLVNADQDQIYAKHFFNHVGCDDCLPGNEVLSIFSPTENVVWIGTNNGLAIIHGDTIAHVTNGFDSLQDKTVNCFAQNGEAQYLIGTNSGLYALSIQENLQQVSKGILPSYDIRDVFVARDGRIWIASFNDGVTVLNKDGSRTKFQQNLENPGQSINYNRVNEIFEDSFGVLWIGTSGGGANYVILDRLPFHQVTKKPNQADQLISNYITAIEEMEGGYSWIGTRVGLSVLNVSSGACSNYSMSKGTLGFDGDHVSAIFTDSKSRRWLLTREGGLTLVTGSGNALVFTSSGNQSDGWPEDTYIGLAEDDFGRLWISTFKSGVIIYDPNTDESDYLQSSDGSQEGLPTNLLTFCYKDPSSNTIWLGSRDKGLIEVELLDQKSFKIRNYKSDFKNENSLSWDYVWPIIADQEGTLWVGTIGGGLNKLSRNEQGEMLFRHYNEKNGLPDNDVESIEIDEEGNLWIGGYGITKFDPTSEVFENFNVKDGLQSNSFKIGSSARGSTGLLYFGGINGLNFFEPAAINKRTVSSHIILTDLYFNNKKVTIGEAIDDQILLTAGLAYTKELVLPGHANDIRIDFDLINTRQSREAPVEFALEGYFDGWRQLQANQSSLDLSNLPSGTYQLKLKLANNTSSEEATKTILTIIKAPPWWRSRLAIGIYVFAIILSYILVRRFTVMQMSIRQNLALANKEKELSHSKIQFFANISHELRTPLSLILGPLEDIIYKGLQPSQVRSSVQIMHKNAQRLMTLINMLLDFRKIENGQMNLMMVQEDISLFLKEIFLVFNAKAEEKHISFHLNVPDQPLPVFIDRLKMEIVITNLLSNAFKFTESYGTIEVSISLVGDIEANSIFHKSKILDNYVLISIKDNGIGMSEEEVRYIFDRFYQVRKLETLSIVGSGIGLSFSEDIIKLHKGSIQVISKEGKGSEFQIKLPLGRSHIDEKHVIVASVPEYQKNEYDDLDGSTFFSDYIKSVDKEGRVNILLIDDNEEIRHYLEESLSQYYHVYTASNGSEGLAMLEKHKVHLIICDVMMPVMDGVEFTKKVKSTPEFNQIPLVLLTAKTAAVHEMEGLTAGADDYIAKPFSLRLLLTRLESLLNRQRRIQQYYKSLITLSGMEDDTEEVDREFVNRAIQIIDQYSEDEEFNVNSLADALAMSRGALYKKIKQNTDRSAVQFIREIKLSKAGKLLKSNNLTVNEVAINVGFRDIKYFRECFKKQFGVTPSVFIKQNKAKS